MTTIKDVAERSGLSATAVSLVLNNAPLARHIPPVTKARIHKAAEELSYLPNIFARSLRNKRSNTIGVTVYDITDSYCTRILRGIDSGLYHSSYLSLLTDNQNDNARFTRSLEMLLQRRIEALIALANPLTLNTDVLKLFEREHIPVVMIGRDVQAQTASSVTVNNEGGAWTALQHLYSLGHREIAFIKGPQQIEDSRCRWKGITKFAQSVRLEIAPKLVVEIEDSTPTYEKGYVLTIQMLARKRPFTALLAFDDMTAFGAIRALGTMGLDVPKDCSVMGFDDSPAAAYYCPPLTTISQHMEKLGRTGVEIALQAITNAAKRKPFQAVHTSIEPTLVVRESTRGL